MKTGKRTGQKKPLTAVSPFDSSAEFEHLLRAQKSAQHYSFRLFVTGNSAQSNRAVHSIRALCEEFLQGHYDLEVVDIYQQPTAACSEQIIAAPTLIKHLPKPLRRLVGNLSDREKLVIALSLDSDPAAKKGTAHEKDTPTPVAPESKAGSR